MTPVRVGILGTGSVVRAFHLPALARNPRAEVVAIGNHRATSLQGIARDFSVKKTYTDFELMARDPEIDMVVNALPNYLHAPVTIKMLQSGKHVLCEKPMAMTALESQAMVAAADAARRKLMIAHVWRSSPQVQWLRDVLKTGKLGTIFKVKAHAIVAGRGPALDSWFVRAETAGGGALADVGIHSFDTISFLFGDRIHPLKVSARVGNYFERLEVEDTASAVVEYDNGMLAEIEAGWYHSYAPDPHGAIELFGSEGYARTLPPRLCGRAAGVRGLQLASIPSKHPDLDVSVYAAQMDHFLDCVLEDRQPACDGNQGLRNMILLEAAYHSAWSGTSVSLEPNAASPHGTL
jgi:predicted dehydrogenase